MPREKAQSAKSDKKKDSGANKGKEGHKGKSSDFRRKSQGQSHGHTKTGSRSHDAPHSSHEKGQKSSHGPHESHGHTTQKTNHEHTSKARDGEHKSRDSRGGETSRTSQLDSSKGKRTAAPEGKSAVTKALPKSQENKRPPPKVVGYTSKDATVTRRPTKLLNPVNTTKDTTEKPSSKKDAKRDDDADVRQEAKQSQHPPDKKRLPLYNVIHCERSAPSGTPGDASPSHTHTHSRAGSKSPCAEKKAGHLKLSDLDKHTLVGDVAAKRYRMQQKRELAGNLLDVSQTWDDDEDDADEEIPPSIPTDQKPRPVPDGCETILNTATSDKNGTLRSDICHQTNVTEESITIEKAPQCRHSLLTTQKEERTSVYSADLPVIILSGETTDEKQRDSEPETDLSDDEEGGYYSSGSEICSNSSYESVISEIVVSRRPSVHTCSSKSSWTTWSESTWSETSILHPLCLCFVCCCLNEPRTDN